MRYDFDRIEREMLKLDMDQTQLAERVGVTSANISQILAGKRRRPRCMKRIAKAIRVPLEDLVIEDETDRRKSA